MSPGKQLPPPSSGQDLTELLRSRHARTDDDAPASQAPAPAAPAPVQQPTRAKRSAMDRRSWYMPKESADALAAALEELHFTTRQPKHVIMAALVAIALEQLPPWSSASGASSRTSRTRARRPASQEQSRAGPTNTGRSRYTARRRRLRARQRAAGAGGSRAVRSTPWKFSSAWVIRSPSPWLSTAGVNTASAAAASPGSSRWKKGATAAPGSASSVVTPLARIVNQMALRVIDIPIITPDTRSQFAGRPGGLRPGLPHRVQSSPKQ